MCSGWSWCILLCPSAVALWRVYCRLRAGGQPSIIYRLSAARDTGTYPCIPSTSLSHIQFHSSSHLSPFPSTSPVCSCPSPSPPPPPPSPPPSTVILRYSFLPFMSISAHFAQGDNELRAVTDKFLFSSWCRVKGTARCRAPVSV